jgi:transposase
MDVMLERCCGLDVHKRDVVACLLMGPTERAPTKEVRRFSTVTAGLRELREWLVQAGCTHLAMESTGPYWKPVFNLLEDAMTVLLANARHIKNVPGRKTDVKDCEWIARLLRHGLVRGSFIPPRPIRELRDLTRYRRQLVEEGARERNRIQKVLEDANLKMGSVVTDVFGVSGQAILEAIVAGQGTPEQMAQLARGRLRSRLPELTQALDGLPSLHHRFLLRQMLDHVARVEEQVEELDRRITEQLAPFHADIERLQTIPGIKETGAATLVAELGTNMDQFPTDAHVAAWAGMCPGNNESAGKTRSTHMRHGNAWLCTALIEAGWAASRTKGTFLKGMYHRIAARRGRKRAIVAVGHKLLIIAYHVLKQRRPYLELGEHHVDALRHDVTKRHLLRRLQDLGYTATLEPLDVPAPEPSFAA